MKNVRKYRMFEETDEIFVVRYVTVAFLGSEDSSEPSEFQSNRLLVRSMLSVPRTISKIYRSFEVLKEFSEIVSKVVPYFESA